MKILVIAEHANDQRRQRSVWASQCISYCLDYSIADSVFTVKPATL